MFWHLKIEVPLRRLGARGGGSGRSEIACLAQERLGAN